MKLGRELDDDLGRVGRRENEEKSKGHESIYGPQQQDQRNDIRHSKIDTWQFLWEMGSTRLANQQFRNTWCTKKWNVVKITTMSWTTLWTKGQLIEKQKIIHLQLVQMDRPEPTVQVDPRVNPEEGKTFMDNSTTL